MSTSVAGVSSHFPDAENGFTTTTSGSVSSGAATVGLNSVAGYTNGEPAVFVIDPSTSKKQTFTGIIDTSGVQVTSVVWTAGTNVAHDAGATVVDYATATHIAMISKGIKVEHAQAGTHAAATITSRTEDTSPATGDFLLTYDTSATALKKVQLGNLNLTGQVIQVVSTNSSAMATGTTVIPEDDTIPQITEGTEFMTLAITPKATTNRLNIRVEAFVSVSNINDAIGALFQDATANALAAKAMTLSTATGPGVLIITHDMVAGTTSSTTFRFRAGPGIAGTLTFNGISGARKFGGITLSNITITEYKA